ncbi:sugar ABC transporter permease [Lachnospiraceae bacterium 48-42]|jgi:ABC-type sugar transport systems, permease components|nr:sugar ABC transporter permease [Dorea sp.]
MNKNKNSLEANNRKSVAITAVIFLLPVILFLAVYVLYPIIDTFVISTYKWNGISANRDFVGLKNWKRLLEDTKFWAAFWHNIVIMVVSVVIQIPLGLALATFLNFFTKKVRISRVFKTVWFFPYLMSSVAIGFLFTYALATNGGIISTISGWFGGQNIDLLGNPKTALLTIILIVSWQFTPFYMVYCMAGYSGISDDIYEASVIDGATRGQYFWKVALPLLKPSLISAAILSMVGSLKYFDLIYVMTNGGPGSSTELMATYMYKFSFSQFNMGYGSTVAGGMFILITAVALLTMKGLNRGGEE